MSTIIYPSPIFGPVHSRRLGVSLGINLLPEDGKFCTFDCIYCECGFNEDHRPQKKLPTREQVREALEARLIDMRQNGPKPDVLTFDIVLFSVDNSTKIQNVFQNFSLNCK